MREERGSGDNLRDRKGGYEGREKFLTGRPISYSTNPDEISCDLKIKMDLLVFESIGSQTNYDG